jgi:HPt (histidine-containing phosphotransfer) domain-containing protein
MQVAAALAKPTKQSSTAPTQAEAAIDVGHLQRMTLGEKGLEAEVLRLFDRQAELLLARMQAARAGTVVSFAHTLKGSARGIGAWQVANAAEAVELAASGGDAAALRDALEAVAAAVAVARMAITEHLRAPPAHRRP